MDWKVHFSVVVQHHQGRFMDDLCSGGSVYGSSVESSSSCLPMEPAAGSKDGDQEGHPEHRYDMSSLMAQLPQTRRGLSRFYDGKSQSFRSLGSVKVVEDLPESGRGRRNGCKKDIIAADLHGCSNLSRVIRKASSKIKRLPTG